MRLTVYAPVFALAVSACATSGTTPQRPPAVALWARQMDSAAPLPLRRVEVMLVGTFHFAQQDTTKVDILAPARQREIAQVVMALARFRPTKIFVERQPYYWQRRLDSTYALYKAGKWTLPRNEVYQLGYRLAKTLGHERVYPADHPGFWLGDSVQHVATKLGQLDVLNGTAAHTMRALHEVADDDVLLTQGSIGDALRWLNDPEYVRRTQDFYFNRLARIGNDSVEAGPDLVAEWYRRNIKIYRTVLDQLGGSEERIMVIIGGDHVPPLQHFFDSNAGFRVIPAAEYLQ
jgi:hypothetical protein